jgi:hypothetical protein
MRLPTGVVRHGIHVGSRPFDVYAMPECVTVVDIIRLPQPPLLLARAWIDGFANGPLPENKLGARESSRLSWVAFHAGLLIDAQKRQISCHSLQPLQLTATRSGHALPDIPTTPAF